MASIIPEGFVDYYFGDCFKQSEVANAVAEIAAACLSRFRAEPWRLAEMTAGARSMYISPDAPVADAGIERHPAHTMLSAMIAEASRCLCAGASLAELRAGFGLVEDEILTEGLRQKVRVLESLENEQYAHALSVGALG